MVFFVGVLCSSSRTPNTSRLRSPKISARTRNILFLTLKFNLIAQGCSLFFIHLSGFWPNCYSLCNIVKGSRNFFLFLLQLIQIIFFNPELPSYNTLHHSGTDIFARIFIFERFPLVSSLCNIIHLFDVYWLHLRLCHGNIIYSQ